MEIIKILFEVNKIIYRDDKTGYTLANVKILNHPEDKEIPTAEPIVGGYFNVIHEKDEFSAEGCWVDTGENGFRFNVNALTLVFPETEKGMIAFIVRFAKGVGIKTAKKIVETFKENTFNVIINEPDELMKIEGITEKRKTSVHESISNYKNFEDVIVFLSPLGLSYLQILDIYENLGISSLHLIKDNPYILYKNSNLSFGAIDSLAFRLKCSHNSTERIKTGILNFIDMRIKNRGDMYTLKSDVLNDLNAYLNKIGSYKDKELTKDEIIFSLDLLIRDNQIIEGRNEGDDLVLYKSLYKTIEDKIIKELEYLVMTGGGESVSSGSIFKAILDFEKKKSIKLAKNQKKAINMALNNRISILNGGPGTGKTQTINAIIDCFKHIKPLATIELAAPTGRAAKRMTELTGQEAKTIHRLIGIKGFTVEDDELNEIEADLLVIDEASMIDAYVFYKLLEAVSEKTKVLIVGDYRQLPSVGAGLILRDLVDSNVVPVTTLNEVFRQKSGSQIIDNAYKIINGEKDLKLDNKKEDFYFINQVNKEEISKLILNSIKRLLDLGYKIDNIQVLSVMNKGDLGTLELNRRIQGKFNPSKKGVKEIKLDGQRVFRVNDKVMQTVNNYDLEVFNGEVGKITSINGDEIEVDFGDKEIIYNAENIDELTLAYAITVHKSQGSEMDAVIIPIHKSLEVLLNRNIIYTAVTRAKKKVILIGDNEELDKGIDRVDGVVRNSMIKEKLREKIFLSNAI